MPCSTFSGLCDLLRLDKSWLRTLNDIYFKSGLFAKYTDPEMCFFKEHPPLDARVIQALEDIHGVVKDKKLYHSFFPATKGKKTNSKTIDELNRINLYIMIAIKLDTLNGTNHAKEASKLAEKFYKKWGKPKTEVLKN